MNPAVISGRIRLTVGGRVHDFPNLVVTLGREWIADRIIGRAGQATRIMLSDGSHKPEPGDIEMHGDQPRGFDVIARDRVDNEAQFTAKVPAGAAVGFFTEGALCAGDIMVCRSVFPPVELREADEATLDWFIKVT